MAFGVASGAGALAGLYGAIFTGFFAALFGGTPAQVTGPTGPMTVIMASVLASTGSTALAFTAVFLSGLIQILFGVLRLGGVIRLVPVTVLSGFMTGIGGIICSLQLPVMFGYSGGGSVMKAWSTMPKALMAPNLAALAIGSFTLLTAYKLPDKYAFKIPKPLIALVISCLACTFVLPALGLSVPMLPAIPGGLPTFRFPMLSGGAIATVASASLSLAVLGAIDSLLTSLVSDSLTSSFHDSNRELIGQGIGNSVAGLFGGSAGAGATMRTVVNVRTGGRTPVAGAMHSVCLLIVVMGLGPLAKSVPLSCLAGVLIKSGLDVVDWPLLAKAKNLPKRELLIIAVTFYMTVFVDLIAAVVAGWVLAIFIEFYQSADRQLSDKGVETTISGDSATVALKGPVNFGGATGLLRKLVPKVVGQKSVTIDMSGVTAVDASAVLALTELLEKIEAQGGSTKVCGLQSGTMGGQLLTGLGLMDKASNSNPEDAA